MCAYCRKISYKRENRILRLSLRRPQPRYRLCNHQQTQPQTRTAAERRQLHCGDRSRRMANIGIAVDHPIVLRILNRRGRKNMNRRKPTAGPHTEHHQSIGKCHATLSPEPLSRHGSLGLSRLPESKTEASRESPAHHASVAHPDQKDSAHVSSACQFRFIASAGEVVAARSRRYRGRRGWINAGAVSCGYRHRRMTSRNQLAHIENMITKKARCRDRGIDGTTRPTRGRKRARPGITVIAYYRLITGSKNVDYYATFRQLPGRVLQAQSIEKS